MSATNGTSSIYDKAQQYLNLDKNPKSRAEIEQLVKDKNEAKLHELLDKRMEFGTAGLRAAMGAGYSRMNDLTVIQASQGLCMYMLQQFGDKAKQMGIVIGHDHRDCNGQNSESFAKLIAAVFLHKGFKVWWYPGLVHTPMVPFGVRVKEAAGGVMVTASHNPKEDNGYKVYWSNGTQIIPPHDSGIAKCIEENLVPWTWDYDACSKDANCVDVKQEMQDLYFEKLEKLSIYPADNKGTDLKFVYTAMHGVGHHPSKRSFVKFSFPDFIDTKEQVQPDPTFPTVAYPNPEEGKGALQLSMATAEANGATIILANDPDADRLATAEQQRDGHWHVFSGNQIGALFAGYLGEEYKKRGGDPAKAALVTTTVSSKMLSKIAEVEGFDYAETLTGFKWLGNKSLELVAEGKKVLVAYEQAIGFMVSDFVYDKDGVTALGVFSEMATQLWKNKKMKVYEYLQTLYDKYGWFVSNDNYFICHDPPTITKIFNKIRYGGNPQPSDNPTYPHKLAYPTEIGGSKVVYIRDLTNGYDSKTADHKPTLPVDPKAHMITFKLENGCWITLRTSGTEPKVKYYTEMAGKNAADASAQLEKIVAGLDVLFEPEKNNLVRPKV